MAYRWWKLRVCLYSLWYQRRWPADDISEAEWRESFEDDDDPWQAFLEGWCRD